MMNWLRHNWPAVAVAIVIAILLIALANCNLQPRESWHFACQSEEELRPFGSATHVKIGRDPKVYQRHERGWYDLRSRGYAGPALSGWLESEYGKECPDAE